MEEQEKKPEKKITLSKYTQALVDNLKKIVPKKKPDDLSKINVSQTVSFLAIAYEKLRNAVEYREDHQVRRAAIERILKRRLMINPEGKGEAENLLRELLWARYFENNSLGNEDIEVVQKIINQFFYLKKALVSGREQKDQVYLYQFLLDLLTAEIEETLHPEGSSRNASFTFFIFQVLRKKIKIDEINENLKDAYFLAAIEKAYRRSDNSYQRYHLFVTLYNKSLKDYSNEDLDKLITKLPQICKKIDEIIKSPYVDKLTRYAKSQLPPFLILIEIIKNKFNDLENILTDKDKLWQEVEETCRERYQYLKSRIGKLALRSFIYIFLTKMAFALILEYPVSLYIYHEVNITSVIINSIFPAILMLIIIYSFRLPNEENTKKIFQRIVDIVNVDKSFETTVNFIPKKSKVKKPILIFGFTIFYTLTFVVTLTLIYEMLSLLNFNLISQIIFIFFISVVTFFSFRIKQLINEYRLEEKSGVLSPLMDLFFMPILSLGKFFSSELSRLNFLIFIFDFIIEAPFKLVFEIVEEWISFVKKRKDEII